MKIIEGKYNKIKVFTDLIEDSAVEQIQAMADSPIFEGSKICIMPDVHAGVGCTIGTTMTIKDKVVPNMVGVDIGCGMFVSKLAAKKEDIDLKRFDEVVRLCVPSGFGIHSHSNAKFDVSRIIDEIRAPIDRDKARRSVGTLGGGNHFIELDESEDGEVYLVVHSGSRHLGVEVADYYQKLAEEKHPDVPKDFAYCEGRDMKNYLYDMRMAQAYAQANRIAMVDSITAAFGVVKGKQYHTIHNYIDFDGDKPILRKGAISAGEEEEVIIPINMRDGSLICKGKGNKEWNYSAPHGAGRLMSRGDAKRNLSMEEFKKEMDGIYSTCVSEKTIDESPMAYKPIENILDNAEDTVRVVKHIKPFYNFKAQ